MNTQTINSETRQYSNDLCTPMSAYLKINGPNSFLLESVEKGENIGRYSIIGYDPLLMVQGYQDYMSLIQGSEKAIHDGNPLDHLKTLYSSIKYNQTGMAPVTNGFWILCMGKHCLY